MKLTAFSLFRITSIIEGLSYLFLVFVAMPMKYLGGEIYILKFSGMLHGILFIFFVLFLYFYYKNNNINIENRNDLFIYSLSPFGFILIESNIKKS